MSVVFSRGGPRVLPVICEQWVQLRRDKQERRLDPDAKLQRPVLGCLDGKWEFPMELCDKEFKRRQV